MDIEREVTHMLGDAMAEIVDEDMIYGLDEKAHRWHRRLMLQEIREMTPFPRSKRVILTRIKG